VGDPAGPESRDGPRWPLTCHPVRRPGPGREVLRPVRHGAPRGRDAGHPHPDPGPERQRPCRARDRDDQDRVPRLDAHPEVGGISIERFGPMSSTTTAGGPIAPSASPLHEPKRGTRSPSVRTTFADEICSAGSSTSTTPSRRDRIWVSDPHGLQWWSNNAQGHVQAVAWLGCGRRVEPVDLERQSVRFRPQRAAIGVACGWPPWTSGPPAVACAGVLRHSDGKHAL
jgi:hypothetical protein